MFEFEQNRVDPQIFIETQEHRSRRYRRAVENKSSTYQEVSSAKNFDVLR